MRLVLQIAAGILLAGVTAFAGKTFVDWAERTWQEHRYKIAAQVVARQEYQYKIAAQEFLSKMTPEMMATRCGPPVRDRMDRTTGLRSLIYESSNSQLIEVLFDYDKGQWIFSGAREFTRDAAFIDPLAEPSSVPALASREKIALLPCFAFGLSK